MSNAVEFILSLKNKVTGPARAAKASLDGVKKSLETVNTASRTVARASGLGAGQLYRYGTTSKRAGQFADVLGRVLGTKTAVGFARSHTSATAFAGRLPTVSSMVGSLTSGAASLGPILLGVGAALLAAGAGGVGLVAAGAKYAGEMASFKENTLFAFKYITGSEDKAQMMFDMSQQMARVTGGSTTQIAESVRELMAGGFDATTAKNLTLAMADVKAMNPATDTSTIAAQIAQMKGAGRVLAEDLKPLLNAGVNDDIFYQVLREMTGKTDQKDLKKMLEQGKVSADTGIAAIQETINRMGGNKGLGSVAAARAKETVGGQVDAMKGSIERLFMGIESGPAGSAIGRIATQIGNMLDPQSASGQKTLALMNQMATMAGRVLDSLDGGTLGQMMGGIQSIFETMMPIAMGFWDGLSSGVGEAVTAVRAIMSALPGTSGMTLDLVGIAKALGTAFAFVAVGIGSVVAIIGGLVAGISLVIFGIGAAAVDLVGWLAESLAHLVAWASEGAGVAKDFIAGLVGGIVSGAVSVVDAMKNMGKSAIDAVKETFRIKSPSRVMMEVGGYVAEGFTQGVDAGAPDASAAVAGIVSPTALGSLGAGASAGAGFSVGGITVNVNGSVGGDAEGVAAAVREEIEEAMRVIFQRYAGELGMSPQGV